MKRILFLIIILFLFSGIALGYELGAGSGTGYPSAIDTDTSVEVDYPSPLATTARSAVPNDTNAAVIAIETELGVNPSGAYDTLKARLDGDLDLYYLKTAIDTLPEMEAIWVIDVINSTELSTYCETTQDYLKTSENNDYLDSVSLSDVQAATTNDFHNIGGTDANTTYTGTVNEIVLTGTVFSLDAAIARDTELHAAATVTTTNGLSIAGQQISLGLSSTSTHGALSDTDWNTFNNKVGTETDPTVDTDAEIKAILVDEVTKFGSFTAGKNAIIYDASGIISQGTNTDTEIATAVTRSHVRNEDTKIQFYDALTSDHSYSGLEDIQPVGESVVFGQLLYFNWTDKEWKIAKADVVTTMPGLRIALETKADGQTCKMLVKGYIRDDSTFEFAGAMIYVSAATAGAMTSTAPSTTGQQVQRVGVAKSADVLFFDPSIDVGEI